MTEYPLNVIHFTANEYKGYWSLRLTLTQVDNEGYDEEPLTWRGKSVIPRIESPIDVAWCALISMAHILEKEGSIGNIRGAALDEPLF
jgi:hypothetical protein